MLVETLLPTARGRLFAISDDSPLIEAARLLRERRAELVVVCNKQGVMVGVITKTDVVGQISHCEGSGCMTAASTVMTHDVVSCRPDDWLHDVWSLMKQRKVKHVPVAGPDGHPVGVLAARDVLQVLLGEAESAESLLRDYVMSVGYQ